jgi:hypothetical protein
MIGVLLKAQVIFVLSFGEILRFYKIIAQFIYRMLFDDVHANG